MHAARWFASRLEHGSLVPVFTRPLAAAYAALAAPALRRPVDLPRIPVVGIGGAVLGGAGKTLVAIAYARALALSGARVALVSHGYHARTQQSVRCHGDESVDWVGDDALVAARNLGNVVDVWVGKNMTETIHRAASGRDVVVVDGLLQARPRSLARSVLVLDALAPWGAGMCIPAGDLRARPRDILHLCDEVVWVDDVLSSRSQRYLGGTHILHAPVEMGLICGEQRLPLQSMAGRRVGLLTLVARPGRVWRSLEVRGIRPVCAWEGDDHGTMRPADVAEVRALARVHGLDGWIVTTKCVTHLARLNLGAEQLVIDAHTRLDPTPRPVLDCRPCVPRES